MTHESLNRNAPEYIEAVVRKKPHIDDPKDQRIQRIIRDKFLQEQWAEEAFTRIRDEQIAYMRDAAHHAEDPDYIHNITQETLHRLSGELRSRIEEGAEHLEGLHKQPVIIATNHLGTYKLNGINPQSDLGDDIEKYSQYDFMYPYPLYFAALSPVAEELGDNLSYASDDFPGVYGRIHTNAGFVHVPPPGASETGRMEAIKEQTAELFVKMPNTVLVTFPEGGTSGKYNEAGPYDLLPFKTGTYVTAAQLEIPVLMVAQYFDPQNGMRLKIFPPEYPKSDFTREDFQSLASRQQAEMQTWLSLQEEAALFDGDRLGQ